MRIGNSGLSDATVFALRALLFAALPTALLAAAFAIAFAAKSDRGREAAGIHSVVILIASDDEKIMGHAISYSMNITRAFAARHHSVKIEIVANGAGIKLLRADTSPLRQKAVGATFMDSGGRTLTRSRMQKAATTSCGGRIS